MSSAVPPPSTAAHHQHRPHPPSWFHVHHVRDSLTRRISRHVCSLVLSLLALAGILLFIIYLALRPHRPRFHVSSFSITPGTLTPVSFLVNDRNPNGDIGIHYEEPITCSVFYGDRSVGAAVRLLFPFYQPPKNTTLIRGAIDGGEMNAGDEDRQQFATDSAQGEVEFRLELSSAIRFRVTTWDAFRHRLHVSCRVVVGSDGNILPEWREKRCSIYFV